MGRGGEGGQGGGGGDEAVTDGAGRPTVHSTGAASAVAAGGPVSGARSGRGEETNDAGYLTAHFTGVAPAAPVRGPVSMRPAPSIGGTPRTERGGDTPRSMREEEGTADKATEEIPPPNGCKRLMRVAKEGGKGEGAPPSSSKNPRARSEGEGGYPQEAHQGYPP